MTPPGIDPGTVRLVAQRLNQYATPGPLIGNGHGKLYESHVVRKISSVNIGSLTLRVDEHRLRVLESNLMTFSLQHVLFK